MKKDKLIVEWMKFASEDYETAKFLTGMIPEPLEIICFHCQQAAEKALKAYLIRKDIQPPKTHDLDELIDLCSENEVNQKLRENCILLNGYSVITRYPSPQELIVEDREMAINAAKTVLDFVKQEIE
ncbi:MAG: HEPN domain-containing protein [Bacteroidales bacterium]|nr:HEPN domain-containing protein [Bacteroidales bacterium]